MYILKALFTSFAPNFLLRSIVLIKNLFLSKEENIVRDKLFDFLMFDTKSSVAQGQKQIVVCMVGLPQSGKTTIAEGLSDFYESIRISNNEIRERLYRSKHRYGSENFISLDILDKVLSHKERHHIVMDSNHVNQLKRRFVEAIASKHGAEVVYITIHTKLEHVQLRQNKLQGYRFDPIYKISYWYQEGFVERNVSYKELCDVVNAEFLRQEPEFEKWVTTVSGAHFYNYTASRIDDFGDAAVEYMGNVLEKLNKKIPSL